MVTIRIGDTEEVLTWEQWESRVQLGRIPEYALVRFDPVTGTDFVPAAELDLFQSLRDDSRRNWADTFRSGPPPWMTGLIAGVQIRLWWLIRTGPGGAAESVVDTLALWQPAVLEDGQVWRLLSMGILHVDLLHILSNLSMLVYVGWNLERALGRLNLLVLFLASVLGGSVLSMLLTPEVSSLGASGGVLGVVAAATIFGFVRHNLLNDRARVVFGWALLPYLVAVYWIGWTNEGTDNWAHTGGLVTGALLALVLDPPGVQRRKGWNLGVVSVVTGLATATLLAAWLGGPYLIGTTLVSERSLQASARTERYRELDHLVPQAWRGGSVLGERGWVSPADVRRGLAVRVLEGDRPAVADEALATWLQGLRDDDLEPTTEPPFDTTLGGWPARAQWVHLDASDALHIVAVRGVHTLQLTWSQDRARANRLAPLRERLLAGVVWQDPESLVEARTTATLRPRNRALQREYAEELLRIGDVDEAQARWRTLADERRDTPDGWIGLLEVARFYPDRVPDHEPLWREALEACPLPQVTAEVAGAAIAAGDDEVGLGLLELGWVDAPGERYLRRARKLEGLPTALTGDVPAHLLADPLTGAPLTAPRRQPVPPPFSLETARRTGRQILDEREQLARALQDGAPPLPILVILQQGTLPPPQALADTLGGVVEDLRGVGRGADLRWAPEPVLAWVRQRLQDDSGWIDSLEAVARPPSDGDAEPTQAQLDLWYNALGMRIIQGPEGAALRRG